MLQTERVGGNAGRIDDATGGIINILSQMEKGLKIWQALLGTIVVLISFISIIVNLTTTISNQRLEIDRLKSDGIDFKLQIKDINQRQEQQNKEISQKLTDILVALQNKQDKKEQ